MSHNSAIKIKYIRILIANIYLLTTILSCQSFASSVDEYIYQTHEIAKSAAQSAVKDVLLGAMQEVLNMKVPNKSEYSESVKKLEEFLLKIQADQAAGSQLFLEAKDIDSNQKKMSKDFAEIYNKYLDLRTHIKSISLSAEQTRRDSYEDLSGSSRMIKELPRSFQKLCTDGYYVNPFLDVRPYIRPWTPTYSFNFKTNMTSDFNTNSEMDVQYGSNAESVALTAILSATNVGLAATYLSGQPVMTSAAFAALNPGTQTAAAMMGMGITAVIVAAIVIDQTKQAREKADEYARENRRGFDQRAGPNDVNKYFQEICGNIYSQLSTFENEMDLYMKNPPSFEAIDNERKSISKIIMPFLQAANDLKKVQIENLKDLPAEAKPEEIREKWNIIYKTKEYLALEERSKELTMENIISVVKSQLKLNYLIAFMETQKIEETFFKIQKLSSNKTFEIRSSILRKIATDASIAYLELKSGNDLSDNIAESSQLRNLLHEIDNLTILFVENLVLLFDKKNPSWDFVYSKTRQIENQLNMDLQKYPNSPELNWIKFKFNTVKRSQQKLDEIL